jgi:hypothetical protein
LANVSELRELFAISVSKQQKHQNWEICNFRHQTLGKLAVSESQQQSIKSEKSAVSPSKQPKQKKTSKLGSFPISQSQQQKNETLNSKSIKSGKICNFSKHTAKALEVIHE